MVVPGSTGKVHSSYFSGATLQTMHHNTMAVYGNIAYPVKQT